MKFTMANSSVAKANLHLFVGPLVVAAQDVTHIVKNLAARALFYALQFNRGKDEAQNVVTAFLKKFEVESPEEAKLLVALCKKTLSKMDVNDDDASEAKM